MQERRVFISAAAEDAHLRDALVGQARHGHAPFQFVDYALEELWDNVWKTNCRTRIEGCDAMIAIITGHTARASRQLWEIACADQEALPVLLIYGGTTPPAALPPAVDGRPILTWSWEQIAAFLGAV